MTMTDEPTTPTFVAPGVEIGNGADPLAALATPANRTVQSAVLDELKREVHRELLQLGVPDRPGWSVDYDVMLDADLLNAWTKQVTEDDGFVNLFEMGLLGCAGQCRAIRKDGEIQYLEGKPVTFVHPAMAELYGSTDVTVTVREFYGVDNVVAATWNRIMAAAGAGSLDPTTASPA